MRHNFWRRLSALLLAFALALPMAVTPAWADAGDDFRVEIKTEDGISLTRLESSTGLTAETVGAVDGSTVTYRWSCEGGMVSISPTTNARTTIKPIQVGTGSVKVTATCTWEEQNGGTTETKSVTKEASVNVTVTSVPAESLTFSGQPATMKTRETHNFYQYLVFTPGNATHQDVSWSVYPSGIVTVDEGGNVKAEKTGKVTITARSAHDAGAVGTCSLEIIDADTPTVTLSPAQGAIPTYRIGETFTLKATVTPDTAGPVTWESNRKTVADVDANGVVTCKSAGTAIITASSKGINGQVRSDSRTVTVIDPGTLSATSIAAKGSTVLSLSAGEEMQLGVTVTPASAQVTWSSDDWGVVTVDPATGIITAAASGKANVTATAQKSDGTPLIVKFEITVMGRATSISFRGGNNSSSDFFVDSTTGRLCTQFDAASGGGGGRTKNVSVIVTAEGGSKTNTYVVWSSNDTSIVTVAAASATNTTSAVLTIPISRPAGRATITAAVYDSTTRQPVKDADGEPLSDTLDVVVSGITLTETSITMYEGEAKSLSVKESFGAVSGTTATTGVLWTSSDSSVATMEGGTLNAWSKGTCTITATTMDGNYTATCSVTVTEDPGTIVNAGTAAAGNAIKLGTASVRSQLNSAAQQRGGGTMSYITSIFISPTQGVVYNTYTSEADTGAGVSMQEKYTVTGTGPDSIEALSFVPAKTYSGEARISYIGYTTTGQSVSGVITVSVTGMGESGSDVTYTTNAAPVTFQAEDFNIICNNKTGRSLKYVTFTPPSASAGTLYENYTNDVHPGQKVVNTTQYNRTGTPSLNSVTFVPADGYSGTVKISYRAVDSANTAYTGTVSITVNKSDAASDPADIYYTAPKDGWATFRAVDFANASLRTIGETLSHVRFSLPPSSEGTLFYNYRGFGNYDTDIASTTSYYVAGTPSLGAVSFVPATTSSGQTVITYTGYSTRGTTFTGRVYVGEGASNSQVTPGVGYTYTVNSGSAVTFNVSDFNSACLAATGATLNYIRFTALPTSTQGTLRYRTGNNNNYSNASTYTSFYRTSTSSSTPLIGNVSFLANASYTGIVRIPYTGYNTNNVSFTGEVTIQVTPNTIIYTGTTASPLRLSASRIRSTVSATFSKDLSYIEFTSLPDSSAGYMYLNYSGYGTGTRANTGVRYYVSTAPSIDQLSFVPKGRYAGDATATYTAYSTSGERMSGQITFRISATGSSSYFTDMGNYAWAGPSVDYLYQNKVTNGITSTTFGPSQQILRRDFVLMLYRAFRFTGGSAVNTGFADVPANAYYAQAVSAAKQLGIANGDGVNFMPGSRITRQDAMVMIKNAMVAANKIQGTASTSILNNFADGTAVSSYARDAVSTLVQMGAVTGDNGRLNPQAPITRAEAAVILHFVMTA